MERSSALPRLIRFLGWTGLVLLLFMTLLRLSFYFFFSHQGYGIADLGSAFFMGLRYDLRVVSLVMLVLLVLGSIPLFHPFRSAGISRGWTLFFAILCLVLVFFYVIDFAHYAYLSQRLNASVLNYLEDTGISAEMVWQSYPVLRLVLLLAGVSWGLFLLIRWGHRRIQRTQAVTVRRNRIWAFVAVFLITGFFIFGRFNQYPLRWSDAFSLGSDYKANLALNPFETFFNTLRYRGKIYDPQKVESGYPTIAAYYGLDPKQTVASGYARSSTPDSLSARKPNIILVICESFSAYKSSMWANPLNTTPFFDSISRKGLFFDRCFTPAYGTARGVWATLTGLPDVDIRQTASRNPQAVNQQMIMPQFEGYEKYYFIGGSPSWANIRGLLMNNIPGLHLYEEENLKSPRLDVWGVSDKNLFVEASQILGEEKKPFFAVIQTADNHRPYSIPAEDTDFIRLQPSEDSLDRYGFRDQPSYDMKLKEYNAFRYTDYTFRKFMEAAQRQPYFDNTLFVFIGDHGIAGDVGSMFPFAAWTDNRLANVHVPLLFFAPSWLPASRVSKVCSQVDVMPTIAGITGMPVVNTTLGRDLTRTTDDKAFAFVFDPDYRKIGIVKGDYYYRKEMLTGKEVMLPVSADTVRAYTETEKKELAALAEAVYQTAGYLMLNNKKKQSR